MTSKGFRNDRFPATIAPFKYVSFWWRINGARGKGSFLAAVTLIS